MSYGRSNNPTRELGLYGLGAYLARQMDDAGVPRCAYCTQELTPTNRTLDHVDGGRDGYADGDRVVAACAECNSAAGRHDAAGLDRLATHLADQGIDPKAAARRVKQVLRLPLPERSDPDVVRITEEHFGARLQEQRRLAAKRRGGDPNAAGTGRTRARQLVLTTDTDDFDAF